MSEYKTKSDYLSIQLAARKLTTAQVQELENNVNDKPGDIESRIRLCSFYFDKHVFSKDARRSGFKHIKWFIDNHPDHPVVEGPEFSMLVRDESDLYEEGKELWLKQTRVFKDNPIVLNNAASFMALNDKEISVKLLGMARAIEPDELRWLDNLAHQYSLGLIGQTPSKDWLEKTYLIYKELVGRKKSDLKNLSKFASIAYKAGHKDDAETSARQFLRVADPRLEGSIHEAYSVIGLIQIENGDIDGAKQSLIESGSWPEFDLANKLIEIDEIDTVCNHLWKNLKAWKLGKIQLLYWISLLKLGKKPKLQRGMLLSYGVGGYYRE